MHTAREALKVHSTDVRRCAVIVLEEKLETAVAIKNILFATDFSGVSEAALPCVTAMSLRFGSMVHVVHVIPEVTFLRPGAPDPAVIGSIYEDAHSTAQEKIQNLSLRLRSCPHRTYVRHGGVSAVIGELIRDQEIDLLILGTHGRTGLGKLLMGSVAEEVFRLATCPVLIVGPRVGCLAASTQARHEHEFPPSQVAFRHVLYATNFRADAARACAYAFSIASEFRSKLTLLHAIEDYGDRLHEHPGPIDEALGKLRDILPDEPSFRCRPELLARYGVPSEVILQAAEESDVDLIVLGVTPDVGHLTATTHLGGSTVHKVVVGANCPVLTVRQ